MTLKKLLAGTIIFSLAISSFCACGKQTENGESTIPQNVIDDKYRTFYEVFLYSFCDSDGDGIGDINGLISKLDYLNDGDDTTTDDLGVNGIWLMPIMESPSYHKYDTVDYMKVDSQYGTNDDFKNLIEDCHSRGINVIIDLAMNHSSSEHPWFKEAYSYVQGLGEDEEIDLSACPYAGYYNFTKEYAKGYSEVEGTDWYYESQFTYSMPDLNLLNPQVQKEYEDIASYWLSLGVDGFRLDAVKYFEIGDTEACVDTLKWFNDYVKSVNPDAYIVCECWDTQNEYAKYYASGVDSMFDFAFADKGGFIANTLNGKKKASSFVDALVDEQELYASYSDSYINAPFYTNHDMGRSAGYYPGEEGLVKVKMAQAMNLLSSGNVFLYYGEELGMKGSGADENKRAPMQWSSDASNDGMCKGPDNMESFEMKYPALDQQKDDESSIYNFVKDAILIRNQNPEIARGQVENLTQISSDTIAAMKKTYGDSSILLIYNVSGDEASIDLSSLQQDYKIIGSLMCGEGTALVEGNTLSMPGYSVVVLK